MAQLICTHCGVPIQVDVVGDQIFIHPCQNPQCITQVEVGQEILTLHCRDCRKTFDPEHGPCDSDWCICQCRRKMPRLPDRWEPYTAFRQWRIEVPPSFLVDGKSYNLYMTSLGGDEKWERKAPTKAVCRNYGLVHRAPQAHCSTGMGCGLYGLWRPVPFEEDMWSVHRTSRTVLILPGVAEYWGRVQLHHLGLRAEYAEPILLFMPRGIEDETGVVAALELLYGVEVTDDFDRMKEVLDRGQHRKA